VSKSFEKKTGKKGPHKDGGIERGDYPRGMRVIPGNGSLTVSWNLSERVGWYEVYYAKKGEVPHPDVYKPVKFKWDSTVASIPETADYAVVDFASYVSGASAIAYKDKTTPGYTPALYPWYSPFAGNEWTAYKIGPEWGFDGEKRPVLGVDRTKTFGKIFEGWQEEELGSLKDPYKPLDPLFANAIPWDGANNRAGTAGTPVKFYGTSVTITGLDNNQAYDVWVRCPNANGERGYGYITGIPGSGTVLPAVVPTVTTPADTTQNLNVSWTAASEATGYRIYVSKYDFTPGPNAAYAEVESTVTSYLAGGLDSDTTYYVWVVAVKDGLPGNFGSPVSGKTATAPATGKLGDKTIAGTSQKVKAAVYIEVNDHNPLNAGNYILEDGTYLFDYVILFAGNIRNRIDSAKGHTSGKPYVHLNDNVEYLLENRTKYIKPLQDKGLKVLLGLLGDHDGVSFGTMKDDEIEAFATDVKRVVDLYELDGVDFDDEWGSKEDWDNWSNNYATISPQSIWTYPTSTWGWPTTVTVYRDPSKGVVEGNGTRTAPAQGEMDRMWDESGAIYYKTIKATREKLGKGKIVSLYEYNTGRYVTASGKTNANTVTMEQLKAVIDYALQPWYNQFIPASINGLPNSIYSPFGMDLSGTAYAAQNGAPNPPIVVNNNAQGANTIYDYATRFKKAATDGDAYNMLYFYALTPSSKLLKYKSDDAMPTITKEKYISMMTEIVFGQKCMITTEGESGDYRKDW
jgi:hypothetical protein